MKCRSCGAEIAERALICYRCGTATTEAKFKPAAAQSRRLSKALMAALIAILLIILALAAFYLVQ